MPFKTQTCIQISQDWLHSHTLLHIHTWNTEIFINPVCKLKYIPYIDACLEIWFLSVLWNAIWYQSPSIAVNAVKSLPTWRKYVRYCLAHITKSNKNKKSYFNFWSISWAFVKVCMFSYNSKHFFCYKICNELVKGFKTIRFFKDNWKYK